MKTAPLSSLSIRGKLTLATLAPLLAVLLLVSFAASWLIDAWVVGAAQQPVTPLGALTRG